MGNYCPVWIWIIYSEILHSGWYGCWKSLLHFNESPRPKPFTMEPVCLRNPTIYLSVPLEGFWWRLPASQQLDRGRTQLASGFANNRCLSPSEQFRDATQHRGLETSLVGAYYRRSWLSDLMQPCSSDTRTSHLSCCPRCYPHERTYGPILKEDKTPVQYRM